MNRRAIVLLVGVLSVAVFASGWYFYSLFLTNRQAAAPVQQFSTLVRPHSPVIGPQNAPVTIVEFFDPSCESCRAFYPIVKQIMAQYPNEVRLVIRYAPFHQGSEETIRMLEVARQQSVYVPVLEAILAAQPEWHDDPKVEQAWSAAARAGLDVGKARQAMHAPNISEALNQDVADIQAVGVKGTPTFFVNGKPLPAFGPQQLFDLVRSEVEAARTNR